MAALIFNLDRSSGGWLCNLDAIDQNQANIYGFDQQGEYDGPTLIINGENSFLAEISRDPSFYRDNGLTRVTDSTIVSVPNAGHNVHFEKPRVVKQLINNFLLKNFS